MAGTRISLLVSLLVLGVAACASEDDAASPAENANGKPGSGDDVQEGDGGAGSTNHAQLQKLIDDAADLGVTGDDRDGDGIPDVDEEEMLRKYRPFYKFTKDEGARPMDGATLIAKSQLKMLNDDGAGVGGVIADCGAGSDSKLNPPEQILSCRPDTSYEKKTAKTRYCIDIDSATYEGASFETIKTDATGLYGHVVKDTVNSHPALKIEYWQLFAFNNQDIGVPKYREFGDHEGDWTSVQVWHDQTENRLAKIVYLIHGKAITFNVPATAKPACKSCAFAIKGKNYDTDPGNFFDAKVQPKYDDNAAELWIDVAGDPHVTVYIEKGGHEFWPGNWGHAEIDVSVPIIGKITIAHLNAHKGDGPGFLVANQMKRPFSVGEVMKPLSKAAKTVLSYNGYWGCTNKSINGETLKSPTGPAAHCSWKWADRKDPLPGCEH